MPARNVHLRYTALQGTGLTRYADARRPHPFEYVESKVVAFKQDIAALYEVQRNHIIEEAIHSRAYLCSVSYRIQISAEVFSTVC